MACSSVACATEPTSAPGGLLIKKAFVDQIGTKKYNIEMEDGENVIIERSGGKGDTSLVLVSNSVKNVDVKVHRD